MLALLPCLVASAFAPAGTPPAMAVSAARSAPASIQMSTENAKTALITSVSGTVASAPVKASVLLAAKGGASKVAFGAYAFSTGSMAVQLALFGIIYRYAVRNDGNDLTKQGMVVVFSLLRGLAATQVQGSWTSEVWVQFGAYFGESALAFAAAAAMLEYGWDKGWTQRLWFLDAYGYEESTYGDAYGRDLYRDFGGYNSFGRDSFGNRVFGRDGFGRELDYDRGFGGGRGFRRLPGAMGARRVGR